MEQYFGEGISELAEAEGMTLWALDASEIGSYWMQSGDPTILCEQLKASNVDLVDIRF